MASSSRRRRGSRAGESANQHGAGQRRESLVHETEDSLVRVKVVRETLSLVRLGLTAALRVVGAILIVVGSWLTIAQGLGLSSAWARSCVCWFGLVGVPIIGLGIYDLINRHT